MSMVIAESGHPRRGRALFARIIALVTLLGAARECAESVRDHRQPDPAALQRLGINQRAFDALRLVD